MLLVAMLFWSGQSVLYSTTTQLEKGCFSECAEEGVINYRAGGRGFSFHFTTRLKLLLYVFWLEIPKNK